MPESITRVDSTGFYAGQNRWVAIALKSSLSALCWGIARQRCRRDSDGHPVRHDRLFQRLVCLRLGVFMIMSLMLAVPAQAEFAWAMIRTRVQPVCLVLDDVWGRYRSRHADLLHRRAPRALCQ